MRRCSCSPRSKASQRSKPEPLSASNPEPLDPVFAHAVSEQLVASEHKRSWLARRSRRVHTAVGIASGLVLAAALTGGALYVAGLPGEEDVVATWPATSFEGTGTMALHLGPAPEGATVIRVTLTCESDDDLTISDGDGDGGTIYCAISERDHISIDISDYGNDGLFTIEAADGVPWSASAKYIRINVSDWGVNAKGETYGVPNSAGIPDMTAAYATNGLVGYIYQHDLWCTGPNQVIPVYESDGETVIGEFPASEPAPGETVEPWVEPWVKPPFCS
jgi:hypothetical protein